MHTTTMANIELPVLQLGSDWDMDQAYGFSHFDDLEWKEAQGLPEVSIKPETPADTQIDALLESYRSQNEGSLEEDWMDQSDFIGSFLSEKLFQGEDFDFTPAPPATTLPGLTGDPEPEVGNHGFVFADEFLKDLDKEPMLQLDKPSSPPSSPTDQVAPEIVFEDPPIQIVLKDGGFLQSPLSPDDVESLLSSASSLSPPPPPASPSSTTVDISCLHTDGGSWSLNSGELYKVVENTKARATPYSKPSPKSNKSKGRKQTASIDPNPSELELELMSKKDRKKLQNKNAAIRYRMKKKNESDQKKTEVEELESINTELREKCEGLEREVKCMRDLINDVRKARGQPPFHFSQSALVLKTEKL